MFKVMVTGGYCEQWISKCLDSIIGQTVKDWEACVVLDPVDNAFSIAITYKDDRLLVLQNNRQMFGMYNLLQCDLFLHPDPDDIMVIVNGDDWLATGMALQVVQEQYELNPDLLLTHGSHIRASGLYAPDVNSAYTRQDFARGVRQCQWKGSHLQTFKHRLFAGIKDEDFKDQSGQPLRVTYDMAIMFPMFEMAGFDRVKHIPEILYVYNDHTPFNSTKTDGENEKATEMWIRGKQPYKPT